MSQILVLFCLLIRKRAAYADGGRGIGAELVVWDITKFLGLSASGKLCFEPNMLKSLLHHLSRLPSPLPDLG